MSVSFEVRRVQCVSCNTSEKLIYSSNKCLKPKTNALSLVGSSLSLLESFTGILNPDVLGCPSIYYNYSGGYFLSATQNCDTDWREDGVKRCNVHSENNFLFVQEIEIAKNSMFVLNSLTYNGKNLTIVAIIVSINSWKWVGLLQAKTIVRPGWLGLWTLKTSAFEDLFTVTNSSVLSNLLINQSIFLELDWVEFNSVK